MGSCISKKTPCSNSLGLTINIPETQQDSLVTATQKLHDNVKPQIRKSVSAENETKSKKKEVFVIHHRNPDEGGLDPDCCTKEEIHRRRRMSFGSNPSFDFDAENVVVVGEEGSRSRSRSGSRERRVSRSPVRRSQSPAILSGNLNVNWNGMPGKLVSVPATVTSLSIDRSRRSGDGGVDANVKRVLVQRNVGSPRSQSPAKTGGYVNERSQSPPVRGDRVTGNVNGRSQSPIEGDRASGSGNVNVNGQSQCPIERKRASGNVNGRSQSQSPAKGNGLSQSPIEGNRASGNVNGRSQSPGKGSGPSGRSQSPIEGNRARGRGNVNGRSQSPVIGNQVNASGGGNGNGRFESPIRGNPTSGNEGGWQQHTLTKNGSRKSPYKRTPLNEIDLNSLPFQPLSTKRPLNKGKEIHEDGLVVKQLVNPVSQNKYAADTVSIKSAAHGTHRRTRSRGTEGYEITKTNYCRINDHHTPNPDQMMTNYEKDQLNASEYDAMITPVILSSTDTLKLPQTLVRSRSARRSRDFDVNVDDASLTPTPATNYTSLLLQDIQKFHKNKNSNVKSNTTITLPPCITKACSIVEAVADLNSTTGTNPSFMFSNDRRGSPMPGNFSFNSSKKRVDHPFVESEVKVEDDLIGPSIHKYATVRKNGGEEICDAESYESNSITGNVGQQNRVLSSSWEPNSGESSDRWMSESNTQKNEVKCSSKGRNHIVTAQARTRPGIPSK